MVKTKIESGFTVIELILAIFILSVGIIGVFYAFSQITILTSASQDRLTAAYLAQEGAEIIRNIRDGNWINYAEDWQENLYNCETGAGCQLDYTSARTSFLRPYTIEGDYLNIDSSGFYSYNSGAQTKFKRRVKIDILSDDAIDAIKISVYVSWDEKATIMGDGHSASECVSSNCMTLQDTLFNWY